MRILIIFANSLNDLGFYYWLSEWKSQAKTQGFSPPAHVIIRQLEETMHLDCTVYRFCIFQDKNGSRGLVEHD